MVFVGQGYAKPLLRQLATDLGLDDFVIFHDVVHSRELIKAIYARSAIFLFPSLYDNAPLVVREAAAFRTPAVLIKDSTAAEVIKDGENGVLVQNDMDSFVGKVVELIRDEHFREKTGIGASNTLCRTWEDVVREVKERYLKILQEWAP
jgi:1,2-diacylglycerol 3-alpha-glucosyltransferase